MLQPETCPKPDVLVLFATTHGHTKRIAERIAHVLEDAGVSAHLRSVRWRPAPTPGDYDGVVVAGSVHAGRHQKELVAFVKDHVTVLNARPTALISVSLTAADDTEESAVTTRAMIDDFLDETGLVPELAEAVAGCLQYLEYDVFTRLLMRVVTHKHAEAHDTHHDHDYTDWDGVDAIATAFAQQVAGATPAYR
jgi:menaquinone-dependent protoporphyrinogen oxidase